MLQNSSLVYAMIKSCSIMVIGKLKWSFPFSKNLLLFIQPIAFMLKLNKLLSLLKGISLVSIVLVIFFFVIRKFLLRRYCLKKMLSFHYAKQKKQVPSQQPWKISWISRLIILFLD